MIFTCEPITLTALAVGTVAAGVMTGVAKKQQADYQAKVADMNAEYAKEAAGAAVRAGQSKEAMYKMHTGAAIGTGQAAYGASGVVAGEGSPVEVLADTRLMSELESDNIRNNAVREGWAHEVEATGFKSQASLYRSAGDWNLAEGITSGVMRGASIVTSGFKLNRSSPIDTG